MCDIGCTIAVTYDNLAVAKSVNQILLPLEPVASVKNCGQVRIHGLDRSEATVEEAGNLAAKERSLVAREGESYDAICAVLLLVNNSRIAVSNRLARWAYELERTQ